MSALRRMTGTGTDPQAALRGPHIIADEWALEWRAAGNPFGYPGLLASTRREVGRGPKMKVLSALLVLVLTVLSGVMDARGFVYAGRAWPAGNIDWAAVGMSMLAFFAGISLYIGAVRFMQTMGLNAVALQSGIWFVATAIGIAAMDGSVVQWTRAQQFVALAVIAGLAWLITTAKDAH
jgi:hypothetical protein